MLPADVSPVSNRQPSLPACQPAPADPRAPGLQPGTVERGPNDFALGIDGPDPNLRVGGTHDQREDQRDAMLALATRAAASYATGHTPFTPRWPSDADVRGLLNQLDPNPPIGADGIDVTHAVYQSSIPNATPQEAYEHFVESPGEVFSAGGMEIRPPTQRLEDGGRYMLEIGGPVPTWLPVEIKLNPAEHSITINTLDGHVLRGEQTFTFTSDCNGGSVLTQDARFQGSTELVGSLQQMTSVSAGQHQTWQYAHREIWEQFNGDRDYAGMGTGFFNEQQRSAWLEGLGNAILHPGTTADVVLDAGGEIANETIDHWSNWGGQAMDWLHLPGGSLVAAGGDVAGDLASGAADLAGDGAKVVVDVLTPW